MPIDFTLPDLAKPQFSEALFRGPLTVLQEISRRNKARSEGCTETEPFKNRKNDLIKRLQRSRVTGESFDQATNVLGREKLLLSLYLEYTDREDAMSWLPAFDNRIARSLWEIRVQIGTLADEDRSPCCSSEHFDRLEALPYLCSLLLDAYSSAEPREAEPARKLREYRNFIFNVSGPEAIAIRTKTGETLAQLMDRFAIPNRGRFSKKLRQVVLLHAIKIVPMGEVTKEFNEIEIMKNEKAFGDLMMGAAALKIMVQRVSAEGGRKWTGLWPKWITRFGCDPRYGRATIESAKWWGWATDSELRLAQQGVTELTLKFFIDFLKSSLEGSNKAAQFSLRSRFLLALFEAIKIDNARLLLNRSAYFKLPNQYRNPWNVATLYRTSDETSMICLRCTDNIYIIEGTHTFGLRMFQRRFPIKGFWEYPSSSYQDCDLRVSPYDCSLFLPTHDPSGRWVHKFFSNLKEEFHIEWGDVHVRVS